MPQLEKLKERLRYSRARRVQPSLRGSTAYDPRHARTDAPEEILGTPSPWQRRRRTVAPATRRLLLRTAIVVSVLILLPVAVAVGMSVWRSLFALDRVALTVQGPQVVAMGDVVTYAITYKNDNPVALRAATLTLRHTPALTLVAASPWRSTAPDTAVASLGTIAPHATKTLRVTLRAQAQVPAALYVEAQLHFTPATRRSPRTVTQRIAVRRAAAAIHLTVEAQKTLASGNVMRYVVHYANETETPYTDAALHLTLPPGFALERIDGGTPRDGTTVVALGTITPRTEGAVTIEGRLEGPADAVKTARFTLQARPDGADAPVAVATTEWATRITRPALAVWQTVESRYPGVAFPGDFVTYTVHYRNTTAIGMRNVQVHLQFDDRIVDYRALDLQGRGALDSATRTITWTAADEPSLALLPPNGTGAITLRVPIRKVIVPRDARDQKLYLRTRASIDSPDVPTPIGRNKTVESTEHTLRLATTPTFTAEVFYDDFVIPNHGPVPPQRGRETTYTIRWTITNTTNDLARARVTAVLPTAVRWTGRVFPDGVPLHYNPRTHRLTWEVGEVPAGAGFYRAKPEVRFQVAVTPTITDVGHTLQLIRAMTLTARDTFANIDYRIPAGDRTTALRAGGIKRSGVVQE